MVRHLKENHCVRHHYTKCIKFLSCYDKILTYIRYGEEADYDYNTRGCKETSSPNCVTGHFTQVVWKNSTKLGIGRAYGMVGQTYCTWTVARYVPPGNYVDQHEENVLDPENI